MFFQIPRCYDSHLHLLATGLMNDGLRLQSLKQASDVSSIQVQPHHFRGKWIVGFGWDHYAWENSTLPTKEILDKIFPENPVALTRVDGHAVWLNSKALELSGFLNKTELEKPTPTGGVIVRDDDGFPTGIFIDNAKIAVDMIIPPFSDDQKKKFLISAISILNKNGFTHARDMSGFEDQFALLMDLDQKNEMTLYLDQNFSCENIEDFDRAFKFSKYARLHSTPHLNVAGIKFYFDGALGSEGAFLSQNYAGKSDSGIILWETRDVEDLMRATWSEKFEVSVHTIGDQAADLIVDSALKIYQQGFRGPLNIEHAEILRPVTILKMKKLDVVCHMQPCHWNSDRKWLRKKLGSLYENVFPWRRLQDAGISLQWGSDSPIENPSVFDNLFALENSPREGISTIQGKLWQYHSHRNFNWGSDCLTTFEDDRVGSVIFDGEPLKI
jgi:predicted amidohydrolase YtcJ